MSIIYLLGINEQWDFSCSLCGRVCGGIFMGLMFWECCKHAFPVTSAVSTRLSFEVFIYTIDEYNDV